MGLGLQREAGGPRQQHSAVLGSSCVFLGVESAQCFNVSAQYWPNVSAALGHK